MIFIYIFAAVIFQNSTYLILNFEYWSIFLSRYNAWGCLLVYINYVLVTIFSSHMSCILNFFIEKIIYKPFSFLITFAYSQKLCTKFLLYNVIHINFLIFTNCAFLLHKLYQKLIFSIVLNNWMINFILQLIYTCTSYVNHIFKVLVKWRWTNF